MPRCSLLGYFARVSHQLAGCHLSNPILDIPNITLQENVWKNSSVDDLVFVRICSIHPANWLFTMLSRHWQRFCRPIPRSTACNVTWQSSNLWSQRRHEMPKALHTCPMSISQMFTGVSCDFSSLKGFNLRCESWWEIPIQEDGKSIERHRKSEDSKD